MTKCSEIEDRIITFEFKGTYYKPTQDHEYCNLKCDQKIFDLRTFGQNPIYGKSYSEMMFKIMRSCTNILDLVKIEAIYIHLNKPELCKQREFDYSLSLFN